MTRTNAAVERQVLAVEAERLADPQPGRVQQLEQRAVARLGPGRRRAGRLEQPLDLVDRQRLGQQARWRGRSRWAATSTVDQPLAVGEPVEALERRRAAAQAGRREARARRAGRAASGPRGSRRRHPATPPSRRRRAEAAAKSLEVRRGRRGSSRRRRPRSHAQVGEVVLDRPSQAVAVTGSVAAAPTPRRPAAPRHASARSSSSRAGARVAAVPGARRRASAASSTIRPSRSRRSTSVTVRPSRSRFAIR